MVAGEPSGDALGARLMAALRDATGGTVRFAGVGGERMTAEGLDSLFPMADIALMGLAEVVPRLPRVLRRIRQTVDAARAMDPDIMVTIDVPSFARRVAAGLHDRAFPLVHYVAPTVWAWRPRRAAKLARAVDHLMTLLPFEPPFFEAVGLPATFVGHPVVESGAGSGEGACFRVRHGIAATAPVLCALPGSRAGEVRRLLPVFGATVARLAEARPGLRIVVPTVLGVADTVRRETARWPGAPVVVLGDTDKWDAFAAADAALAASGTVSLELAFAGVPAVIAYKVSPATAWIVRRLIRVRHASLVNILHDREVIPEFLQQDCTPDRLAAAVARLLDDPAAGAAQRAAEASVAAALGRGGPPPSRRAADVVLRVLADRAGRPTSLAGRSTA